MEISRHWKTIVHTLQEALLVIDPSGIIVAVNPAAEELTGYSNDELVGQSCRILACSGCPVIGKGSGRKWCGLYADGNVRLLPCTITNKNNRIITVIKSASVLYDEAGEIVGAIETIKDMSEIARQQNEINTLRRTLNLDNGYHGIHGRSMVIQALFETIKSVACTEAPVLIQGESGTGKELIARAIHEASLRKEQPYITVNCAALNDNLLESELFGHAKGAFSGAASARVGRFEAAHEGTLFLDEIGDIPLSTQVKLLRALEEKEIERVGENKLIKTNVRIVSATNKNLEELIQEGRFREDLYFRINVFPIRCPPLRNRLDDIPVIVGYFIREYAIRTGKKIEGITSQALELLSEYTWPGNVRELRNSIEYAFVLCNDREIDAHHLPVKVTGRTMNIVKKSSPKNREEREKEELLQVLHQVRGNQSEAGRILGVSRITIWRKIQKYNIDLTRKIRA